MPLLTLKEIADMSPVFRGRIGGAVGRGLMRMLSINKVNALYDHNSHLTGQDFTSSVLQEIGVDYQMINPQILSQLRLEISVRPRQKKASKESRRQSLIYAPAILSEYFRQEQSLT